MQQNILIYSKETSSRLRYVLDYIFVARCRIDYHLTKDINAYQDYEGAKISYANDTPDLGINIIPERLLFETGVTSQNINIHRWQHSFILFYNQPKGTIPFDIFAATFYMLSRYEEYLPHQKDKHNRFPAKLSIAARYTFLSQPIVDQWVHNLIKILKQHFSLNIDLPKATAHLTYDIDMIWKYLHKSPKLNNLARLKDILKLHSKQLTERAKVLNGKQKDPFECFDELKNTDSIYFILTSNATKWDRNTNYTNSAFQKKIKLIAQSTEVGIHPSYYANEQQLIAKETAILSNIINRPITKSRQHFIKLDLPNTYHQLIKAGITDDYSMGYPEANGFRAGTSLPFYWFDIDNNKTTELKVHPFAYMDATDVFYNNYTVEEATLNLRLLMDSIQKTNGNFISIWHNYLIGDTINYPHQRNIYQTALELLKNHFD